MKRVLFLSLIVLIVGCRTKETGELIGVQDRGTWYEPDPYGMVFVPMGSFNMGPNDQDVPFAITAVTKTVSIDPFWMDDTEITNNEYRQYVYWVRDSLARRLLGEEFEDFFISEDEFGNEIDPPYLNWEEEIEWDDEEQAATLEELYLPEHERFFRRKEVDTRKLIYKYQWIDLKQAAMKGNRYKYNRDGDGNLTGAGYEGEVINYQGVKKPIDDRSSFIMQNYVPAYPDTLVWMADYTYSFNEPWTKMYFWHPAFDDYPVVGITWVQANAFCVWRTEYMNNYLLSKGKNWVQDYRLPTEAEWEYAARGGLAISMYPWGGPYTRNNTGCFIANFKPLRGNYGDDGAMRSVTVRSFAPNEYGLYDMAGNVAEWTSNAFDESAYMYTHDLNPDYRYNALEDDPPALKRKVVRGGSWKDVAYYMQCGTRTYEYQDTAKCFIGFRCVRSYLGRDAGDFNID